MVATPSAAPLAAQSDSIKPDSIKLDSIKPDSIEPMTAPTARQYLPHPATISPNQNLMPLTARVNDHDHLEVGGCDVKSLVERYGSPLYVLDEATLRATCQQYRDSFTQYYAGPSQVIYASKAWNCLAVCAIVASEGLGIDVVSGGELYTALQAGFDPSKIYMHGNNKSREELAFAREVGITIVIDNWLELQTLKELCDQAAAQAPKPMVTPGDTRNPEDDFNNRQDDKNGQNEKVKVMIRLTPGIECHTHEYIRTGHLDSKFGFDPQQMPQLFSALAQSSQLECVGLHAHIGSQIFELQPHQDLGGVMVQAYVDAQAAGLPVSQINIGGGLGIRYTEQDDPPSIAAWVQQVSASLQAACKAKGLTELPLVIAEPGRSLIGTACVTAYTIGSQKTVPGIRTYVTVDGGMSDNPRPITYQSKYRALLASQMSAPMDQIVTIAGKHCESGDVLIHDALLPKVKSGDILVVPDTGAYNYSMASNYNRLGRPAAVLVAEGNADLILKRETYEDLVRSDVLPSRLERLGPT
jgi:diaminopimelate decarboxylase